jgi:hypothetical protein
MSFPFIMFVADGALCCAQVGSDEVYTSKMLKAITRLVGQGAKDAEIYAELYRVYHHEVSGMVQFWWRRAVVVINLWHAQAPASLLLVL